MKLHFELFGVEFGVITGVRKKLKEPIAGITNRTHDGYYIPFLDYDDMPFDWLEGELIDIQKQYNLGDLYVFASGQDKFHVVGFDKLTREEYQSLLNRSSCDANYKKIPFTWGRRVATLRATEKQGRKVKLHAVIEADFSRPYRHEMSNAHRIFFEGHYGIETPRGRYDNYENVIVAKYRI